MESNEIARKIVKNISAQLAEISTSNPAVGNTQRQARNHNSEILALPERFLDSIQDLDPNSATFGEFKTMLDYERLDGDPAES